MRLLRLLRLVRLERLVRYKFLLRHLPPNKLMALAIDLAAHILVEPLAELALRRRSRPLRPSRLGLVGLAKRLDLGSEAQLFESDGFFRCFILL